MIAIKNMESNVIKQKVSKSKVEEIKSGKKIKSQIGDEKEYKKVIQDVRAKHDQTEKEKKLEESCIIDKRRNHILYESKYITEKGKNLQISKEAIKSKLKGVEPRKEENIIRTKKKHQYSNNCQYQEPKYIKDKDTRKISVSIHQRQGDIIGSKYKISTYQKQSMTDSGKGPKFYWSQTTKTTTGKNSADQPLIKITSDNISNLNRITNVLKTNKTTNETTLIKTNANGYKINREVKDSKGNILLKNIKSNYVLKEIMNYLPKKKYLNIIKYNKEIQKVLKINYKKYYNQIEIEIIPIFPNYIIPRDKYQFINILEKKSYYHIYFNDDERNERRRYYATKNDNVTKIKIIIDEEIKSFKGLFKNCNVEKINFIKFIRNDIYDMSDMFRDCIYLKELNLNNFKTDNVTDMSCMFYNCCSLKELNLNNFNTINVTDMTHMFHFCKSIEKLNLNNFNTKNVTLMQEMFSECSSLKELNLNNFNTNKVTNMACMFSNCSSLKKLNLNSFYFDKVSDMSWMFSDCSSLKELNLNNFKMNTKIGGRYVFSGCSDELKRKIRRENKNLVVFNFDDFVNDYEDFFG